MAHYLVQVRARHAFWMLAALLSIILVLFVSYSFAEANGRPLTATLSGAAEVPGPGDPDGSGMAHIRLNQGQGRVCYELHVADIATATAAHIHAGDASSSGGVVVGLSAPADGSATGCVEGVDRDLIKDIRQNPQNYYVNVHNAEYPPGALRGQLEK